MGISEGVIASGLREEESCIPWPVILPTPYVRECWSKEFGMVEEEEISAFARSIGDLNPLHHSDEVARKKKIKRSFLLGRITTGVRTLGYLSPTIVDNFPTGMVVEIENVRFSQPLYAGSLPTVSCKILKTSRKLTRVAFEVLNGYEVISYGTCVIGHEG